MGNIGWGSDPQHSPAQEESELHYEEGAGNEMGEPSPDEGARGYDQAQQPGQAATETGECPVQEGEGAQQIYKQKKMLRRQTKVLRAAGPHAEDEDDEPDQAREEPPQQPEGPSTTTTTTTIDRVTTMDLSKLIQAGNTTLREDIKEWAGAWTPLRSDRII